MNLRDNKTYIDELFERVQNGYLNPDEASTLLWAILDSFNRAYLASQDNYPMRRREIQRSTRTGSVGGTTETEERVIWSASGTMTAPDGTETPISKVTLRVKMRPVPSHFLTGHSTPPVIGDTLRLNTDAFRPTCTACGEPVTWVSSRSKWMHENVPAVPHQVGHPSAQFTDEPVPAVRANNGPLEDHRIITRVHRRQNGPISEYLAAVRNVMWALNRDNIKFVKAENDERTTMYFYHELELKSQVGDCQRHPTSSAPGPLYCYKCKGAITFVEVSAGIGHWAHLNPAQQESHKPDLLGPSTGEQERTCIQCQQPIFYGAHPSGGIGWVHYGSVDPDHAAVEEIQTGEDPHLEAAQAQIDASSDIELVNVEEIPEDWDTEDELMGHNTPMDRPKISMPPIEEQSASVGRIIQRLKDERPDTGNSQRLFDVLAGEDPEEYDLVDLTKMDSAPAEPQINISAGSVSPGAYTLWNSSTSDSAAAIHKAHRDGQAEQA